MGKVKFSNNAYCHLTAPANPGDTQLQVDDATLFPGLAAGDWAFISIDMEVVRVLDFDIQSKTITLDPSDAIQGGHPINSTVELRMCQELLDSLGDMGEY